MKFSFFYRALILDQSMNHISLIFLLSFAFVTNAAGQGVEVIVETVRESSFFDRVEALGTLYANEFVELTAGVAEIVTAIRFKDSQQVNAGDILVEMTSPEEHALLEEAKSGFEEAEKQLSRIKSLSQDNVVSQALLDQSQRDYQVAHARLAAIQSRLQDRLVVAPFSGTLGLRNISVGALVTPGDLITTLNDNSQMKLDFSVPAIYMSEIQPGSPVFARQQSRSGSRNYNQVSKFSGEVYSIDNQIDPVTRSIRIRAILPNKDGVLKPGLLMRVELHKNTRQALVVSEEALIPESRNHFVFVVVDDDGKPTAQKRQVQIGSRRKGQVEILQGLAAGELVITHGTTKTRPGQVVVVSAMEEQDHSIGDSTGPEQAPERKG